MTFKDFIERKYVEWQGLQGKRKTIADFAAYLGISQPLLSMWMNGTKKPGAQNIKLLYELYGDELSEALGQNKLLFSINKNFDNFNDVELRLLTQATEIYKKRNLENESLRASKKRKPRTTE